jgi:HSP20 family protein
MNVSEDADSVYADALAPGLDPDSLNISVMDNQLTVSGEKPGLGDGVKAEAYHRNERAAGRFVRTATLPAAVDQDKTTADYKNGLFSIVLPKAEKAKPKQITVKSD